MSRDLSSEEARNTNLCGFWHVPVLGLFLSPAVFISLWTAESPVPVTGNNEEPQQKNGNGKEELGFCPPGPHYNG